MDPLFEYANSLNRETKWHGNHNDNDVNKFLKAGQLSLLYENGSLRYISSGNREIIRMIYFSVRITGWVTIKPVISEEVFDIHPDSFRIKFLCRYFTKEIDFSARFTISGNPDNSLTFSMDGEALNSFEKNRIGFCVLHPIDGCAGESCLITHSNGEMEKLEFPWLISPHQIFSDIKSMKWHIYDNKCTLNFFGDTFETEDHRNWSDASYKTYCTPLSLPFPVKLDKGERINQKIELKVEEYVSDKIDSGQQIVFYINPDKITNIAKIGIGRSTRPDPVTEREIQILKKLKFDQYRVDLYLFDPDWQTTAKIAAIEAEKLEYPVEFTLFFDENAVNQVNEFINWLNICHSDIALIHLFHKDIQSTPDILTETVAPILNNAFPGVKISCGTNANFVQLNRNQPESVHADYYSWSIHPQEHASDNTTLIENLKAQQYTVDGATRFANGKGIWISPVNIQRRFNANIENFESTERSDEIPPQVDNRLMSLFGACWTAGSMKYLLESGIMGVTYFETVGERGILQGNFPSRWPEDFKACEGMIFPVFHLFSYLLNNKLLKLIESKSSHPLKAEILALTNGTNQKLIAVNLTSVQQDVIVIGIQGKYRIKKLHAESYASSASDSDWIENAPSFSVNLKEKIPLEPYSINFIDGFES